MFLPIILIMKLSEKRKGRKTVIVVRVAAKIISILHLSPAFTAVSNILSLAYEPVNVLKDNYRIIH